MNFMTICLIAISLAMDAFAVSISCGFSLKQGRTKNALIIALFFGGFQAGMPIIGWFLGTYVEQFISAIDHWVAFGLLCVIGLRMIYEACRKSGDERAFDPEKLAVLFVLAIATSIDAFAVGLSLSLLGVRIFMPALIIGTITFVVSFGGVYLGTAFGRLIGKRIEVLGGLLLIGIGVKILFDHLS
ncbi:manganese efflux pump [candidate division WOR-3 bacterium]|nr:manganese efflux pump [candidate division WOR-3 bacterium]